MNTAEKLREDFEQSTKPTNDQDMSKITYNHAKLEGYHKALDDVRGRIDDCCVLDSEKSSSNEELIHLLDTIYEILEELRG